MKRNNLLLLSILFVTTIANAQVTDPMIVQWWFNTSSNKYNGILTDVEAVYYTAQNVYIKSSGIPNYYEDGKSVNNGSDLKATWILPRAPQVSVSPTGLQGGQNGLMLDGSVSFTPGDAQSYNNAGAWNRLAYYFEGADMDASNGHSTPTKMYHHHFDNLKLHDFDSAKHSPLVGYAWDGYPVYGPFGYKNADSIGATKRIVSGYKTKSYTTRTNGPAVNGQYPIGCFIEDWQYTSGYGDLDEHNGRFCKTPEYPNGTYAYFTTIDESYKPVYPYFIGPTFYGVISNGNSGPNGGKTTVPATATQYISTTGDQEITEIESNIALFPIPVEKDLTIRIKEDRNYTVFLFDSKGGLLEQKAISSSTKISMNDLPYGVYFIEVNDAENNRGFVKRIVKQ